MSGYNCSKSGDKSGFRGCGRTFSALKYFDEHFIKVTIPDDDTRDFVSVAVDGERCMSDAELVVSGLEERESGVWHNPEMTDRAKDI